MVMEVPLKILVVTAVLNACAWWCIVFVSTPSRRSGKSQKYWRRYREDLLKRSGKCTVCLFYIQNLVYLSSRINNGAVAVLCQNNGSKFKGSR